MGGEGTTSKHFNPKNNNIKTLDLTEEGEGSSSFEVEVQVKSSLRIAPASTRIRSSQSTIAPTSLIDERIQSGGGGGSSYHSEIRAANMADKQSKAPTGSRGVPIELSDPSKKFQPPSSHPPPQPKPIQNKKRVGSSVASPYGQNFDSKVTAGAPNSSRNGNAIASGSGSNHRLFASAIKDSVKPSKAKAKANKSQIANSLTGMKSFNKNAIQKEVETAEEEVDELDEVDEDDEEAETRRNEAAGSSTVKNIKGAAERNKAKLTGNSGAAAKKSITNALKAKGKATSKGKEKEVIPPETIILDDTDDEENDSIEDSDNETIPSHRALQLQLNSNLKQVNTNSRSATYLFDEKGKSPLTSMSIAGNKKVEEAKAIANKIIIPGTVKNMTGYYEEFTNPEEKKKSTKVANGLKPKTHDREPTLIARSNENINGNQNGGNDPSDDFPLVKSVPTNKPKAKSRSSTAATTTATSTSSPIKQSKAQSNKAYNPEVSGIFECRILPPILRSDMDGTEEYFSSNDEFRLFINYGGPEVITHCLSIKNSSDEVVFEMRPSDLADSEHVPTHGLYMLGLSPDTKKLWDAVQKLFNYRLTKGTSPLQLNLKVHPDETSPRITAELVQKFVSGGRMKFGKPGGQGAVLVVQRFTDVFDRLVLQNKSKPQKSKPRTSISTSTSASSSKPTSISKPTIQPTIAETFNNSKANKAPKPPPQKNTLPARRSARQSGGSEYIDIDSPPAVYDNTPHDKVVLVWPFENFEGTGAVSVTHGDTKRLEDGEFLNDTLIEYGLKKISVALEKRDPDLASKVHVFNSFFYKKLSLKKSDDRSFDAYATVRKWTQKFNFFDKKFIIIPINEHLHWYLAIIVNPAAILKPPISVNTSQRSTRASTGGKLDVDNSTATSIASGVELMDLDDSIEITKEQEDEEDVEEAKLQTGLAEAVSKSQAGQAEESMEVDEEGSRQILDISSVATTPLPELDTEVEVEVEGEDQIIPESSSEGGEDSILPDQSDSGSDERVAATLFTPSQMGVPVEATTGSKSLPPRSAAVPFRVGSQPPIGRSRQHSPIATTSTSNAVPTAMEADSVASDRALLDGDAASAALAATLSKNYNSEMCYIFTFDSLGGAHPVVIKKLRDYLEKEALDKLKVVATKENVAPKAAKVPSQPNFCDCGLYLLHFVDKFLSNPEEKQAFILRKNVPQIDMELAWAKDEVLAKRITMREEVAVEKDQWATHRIPIDAREAEEKNERIKKRKEKAAAAEALTLAEGDTAEEIAKRVAEVDLAIEKEKEVLEEPKDKKRKVEEENQVEEEQDFMVLSDEEESASSPAKSKPIFTNISKDKGKGKEIINTLEGEVKAANAIKAAGVNLHGNSNTSQLSTLLNPQKDSPFTIATFESNSTTSLPTKSSIPSGTKHTTISSKMIIPPPPSPVSIPFVRQQSPKGPPPPYNNSKVIEEIDIEDEETHSPPSKKRARPSNIIPTDPTTKNSKPPPSRKGEARQPPPNLLSQAAASSSKSSHIRFNQNVLVQSNPDLDTSKVESKIANLVESIFDDHIQIDHNVGKRNNEEDEDDEVQILVPTTFSTTKSKSSRSNAPPPNKSRLPLIPNPPVPQTVNGNNGSSGSSKRKSEVISNGKGNSSKVGKDVKSEDVITLD